MFFQWKLSAPHLTSEPGECCLSYFQITTRFLTTYKRRTYTEKWKSPHEAFHFQRKPPQTINAVMIFFWFTRQLQQQEECSVNTAANHSLLLPCVFYFFWLHCVFFSLIWITETKIGGKLTLNVFTYRSLKGMTTFFFCMCIYVCNIDTFLEHLPSNALKYKHTLVIEIIMWNYKLMEWVHRWQRRINRHRSDLQLTQTTTTARCSEGGRTSRGTPPAPCVMHAWPVWPPGQPCGHQSCCTHTKNRKRNNCC